VIDQNSSLIDVAFAVCTALDQREVFGVLTGGSAATFWAPDAYQSADADFVLTLEVDPKKIVEVMQALEFRSVGGTWVHSRSIFTVEFPRGPLAVGGELIRRHDTVRRADGSVLHVLSPQDSVRDRLAHFIHWNDRTALRAAVSVALGHRDRIALPEIERWAQREEPQLERFTEFVVSFRRLVAARRPRR
jgi:hypothetical protein